MQPCCRIRGTCSCHTEKTPLSRLDPQAVLDRNAKLFGIVMADFFVSGLAASVINSALKYLTNSITVAFRQRLTTCVSARNITSFYGSSCANNGKDALNTPETLRRTRGYILAAGQSDAGRAGMFSQRASQMQDARV